MLKVLEIFLIMLSTFLVFLSLIVAVNELNLSSFVYKYQTLIAGASALLGAILTVGIIRKQIEEQREQFEEEKKRNELAAKARLHDTLTCLCDFSKKCFRKIYFKLETNVVLEKSALENLYECIRYTDKTTSETLDKIISRYQILNNRISSHLDEMSFWKVSPEILLYNSIELYLVAESGFLYARGKNSFTSELVESFKYPALKKEDFFSKCEDFSNGAIMIFGEDVDITAADEYERGLLEKFIKKLDYQLNDR